MVIGFLHRVFNGEKTWRTGFRPVFFRQNMKQFECIRCGNCCRWSGCVKVTDPEIDAISAFLAMPVGEFLDRFTALMPDRRGLTLTEKPDGSCIFLMEGEECGCRINPVKPRQCGAFPQKWNFPGWEEECGGAKKERKETGGLSR